MTITEPAPDPARTPGGVHDTLRAVIVDDHQLLAESLSLALRLEGVSATVPALTDRASVVRAVLEDPPDVVLLDLDLGGGIGDGSTLVAAFVEAGCRVLVVTGSTDQDRICHALEQGAAGVVRKDVPFTQLLDAALAVARGEDPMHPVVRRQLLDEARSRRQARSEALAPFARLSAREAQVLRTLATGQSVGTIAATWFVSEATVRSQVRSILTKLNASSQLAAIAEAHRSGWLRTDAG